MFILSVPSSTKGRTLAARLFWYPNQCNGFHCKSPTLSTTRHTHNHRATRVFLQIYIQLTLEFGKVGELSRDEELLRRGRNVLVDDREGYMI